MIRSFKHKGLRRFFTNSDYRGIPPQYAARLLRMLDRLDAARSANDMNLPGYLYHTLKGDRSGLYAVSVSANWRLTFRFDEEGAHDVALEDYH